MTNIKWEESLIQLEDVGHVAYAAPDLDLAERFLTDFGLVLTSRTDNALYFRAAGSRHHVYVAIKADESRFLGAAFDVADRAELEKATSIEGASGITSIDGPGGGERVELKTPCGHTIWLEHGVERLPEEEWRDVYPLNFFEQPLRKNISVRQPAASVRVERFGHFVLQVPDAKADTDWFVSNFNLIPSDYLGSNDGPEPEIFGAFLRFDRGKEFVDHHCILINLSKHFGCHHSSFEVRDLDAVMAGHEFLVGQGYKLDAGVGRHMLGSLIYDYWLDPFGQRIEHFTDPDIVNSEFEPSYFNGSADETTQWGMAPDPSFFD